MSRLKFQSSSPNENQPMSGLERNNLCRSMHMEVENIPRGCVQYFAPGNESLIKSI